MTDTLERLLNKINNNERKDIPSDVVELLVGLQAHMPKIIENEGRLANFASSLPQVVYETDKDGKIVWVNDEAVLKTGYSWNDLRIGLYVHKMIDTKDHERALENFIDTLEGNISRGNEYTFVSKTGGKWPVMVYSAPRYNQGEVVGTMGVMTDITEQKNLQKKLVENEEKYRQLFENAPAAIYEIDFINQRFTSVNEVIFDGFEAKEVVVNILDFQSRNCLI